MSPERLRLLLDVVTGAERVLILPHNDPDPDAIASAVALRHLLAETASVPATLAYQGIIGRAENKALVRYLGHPLRHLRKADLKQQFLVALVDTQPGAGNNPLPPDTPVAVVLDHHPQRLETASASFVDVRQDLGANATILTEYLRAADIGLPPSIATALFYGIKTDTMGLVRNATAADTDAYFYLQRHIDTGALLEIERAQVPANYFKSLATTLQAARIYKDAVIAHVGTMSYPDMAAEMADSLLRLEGTRWVICTGVFEDQLILAVRSRSQRGGAGRLAQAIIDGRGTAGGHGSMAGGEVPLHGSDPAQLAKQISRNARQHLHIDLDLLGESLL